MAYRRLADARQLKGQDKPRTVIQKKPEGITGWDSPEICQENDFVEWMSTGTTQENNRKPSSSGDSRDKYRRGFDWCTGLEDREMFRRHSLNEQYRTSRDNDIRSDVCDVLNVWPELKDDLQRQSLDKFIKFMSSPRQTVDGQLTPAPIASTAAENIWTGQRSAGKEEVKIKPNDPERLDLFRENPEQLEGEGHSSASKSSSKDSFDHDSAHSATVESGDGVSQPASASTGPLVSASLQSLEEILGNNIFTSRRFHPHKSRQLGDVRLTDSTASDALQKRNPKTAQTSQFRAKLIYSKKDKNVYVTADRDNPQRTGWENSVQRTYPGCISLTQAAQFPSSGSSHLDNVANALLNKPTKTKLAAMNSQDNQNQLPRLLVMSQISLQESSYPNDQMAFIKPGDTFGVTRMSTLCPVRSRRTKRDTTPVSKVLAYQSDLLDTVKVNIQTSLPSAVVNKPQRDPGVTTYDSQTHSSKKCTNISQSGTSTTSCHLPEIPDTNLRDVKDSVSCSHEVDSLPILSEDKMKLNDFSASRTSLQYLGQQLHQTDPLTPQQPTKRPGDVSTLCEAAATGLTLATASCEDLGCLSLLNLFQDRQSRCTSSVSFPVQPQLSIPRVKLSVLTILCHLYREPKISLSDVWGLWLTCIAI
ncbi:hypothetical protein Btru_014060 [Bulinus truncatus]|nr:hypothetical protein Btru_014060 [Bulinus truncatus]